MKKENNDSREIRNINYMKITEDFYPDFQKAKERLSRKIKNKKVEQTIVKQDNEEAEFLSFNETSINWGGPFKYTINGNRVEGCLLSPNMSDHKNKDFERLDSKKNEFINRIRDYHLPSELERESYFEDLPEEEKRKILKKLDAKSLKELYEEVMDFEGEMGLDLFEYNLYLYGTDDCSHTKGFHTEEEVKEELEYLRMMQPLDIYKDIYERGYVFTN
jgi:hypothetical protein